MTSTPPDHPRPESPDETPAAGPVSDPPGATAPTAEQSGLRPGGPEPEGRFGAASVPGPGYQTSYPGGPYPPAVPPVPPVPPVPFAPVPRPPRVPWVNPDRRSHLLGAGLLGGLVLLAAGFGIGYAVAPSGHHGHGPMTRFERGGAYFPGHMVPGPAGQFPAPGNGRRRVPGAPPASTPAVPATPTATSTK